MRTQAIEDEAHLCRSLRGRRGRGDLACFWLELGRGAQRGWSGRLGLVRALLGAEVPEERARSERLGQAPETLPVAREGHRRCEQQRGESKQLNVTACTGVAAVLIGGTTLHSFASCGTNDSITKEEMATKIKKVKKNAERWRKCRVLVIDEISMLDGDLFEKLEHVAKDVRRDSRPFGGIQVILCGDFHQLPPVSYGKPQAKKFAFQSRT